MGKCKEGKAGFLLGAPYPSVSNSWSSVWAELQPSAKISSMILRQWLLLSVGKDKGVVLGFATQLLISACSIRQARQITRHLTSLLLATASSCFKSFLALQWWFSLRIQWKNPWLFQMYLFFFTQNVNWYSERSWPSLNKEELLLKVLICDCFHYLTRSCYG